MSLEFDIKVISLPRLENRRSRVEGLLLKQGLSAEIFDAHDGDSLSPSEISEICSNSKISKYAVALAKSWKEVVASISRPTIICEDDIILEKDFFKKLKYAFNYLPEHGEQNHWSLIYLSSYYNKNNNYLDNFTRRPDRIFSKKDFRESNEPFNWYSGNRVNECVKKINHLVHGTGCIIVNPLIKDLFQTIFPIEQEIDIEISNKLILSKKIKAYFLSYKGQRIASNDSLGGSSL